MHEQNYSGKTTCYIFFPLCAEFNVGVHGAKPNSARFTEQRLILFSKPTFVRLEPNLWLPICVPTKGHVAFMSKMFWGTVMAIYSATFERVSLSNNATPRGEVEQKFERVEACV